MNRIEYCRGKDGFKYGIFNTATKKFVFGIYEDTPMLAEARLFQKIGDDARKWKFEVRRVSNIPAADVAPMKHSKWEICCDGYYPYCKNCGKEPQGRAMTDYCPNCGARMDGVEHDT